MAPRKPTSPAKPRRVTRARAADTSPKALEEAPKRKTATTSKDVPTTTKTKAIEAKSRVSKKVDTKTPKNTRSTSVVQVSETDDEDDMIVVAQPQPKPTRASRSTRTTTTASAAPTLAAAPRRRIKVTPLDAPVPEPEPQPVKKTTAKEKKQKSTETTTKSSTTRAKRSIAAAKLDEKPEEPEAEHEPKRRGRGPKVATKAEPEEIAPGATTTARKTRGRAKKEDTPIEPDKPVSAAPVTTRQTRARSGSTASATAAGSTINVVIQAPARKKVTFQNLPEDDEDEEKENKRPVTSSRVKGIKKAPASSAPAAKESETTSTGMRAKPIRKPTVATKSTRGATRATKASKPAETEKVMPRVLTPKKITQVAKAPPVDADEEDELAGGKTPVRDLSLSPRRGHMSPVRPMSPVKTLDFTPALQSPEKQRSNTSPGIMSPPRRMPSSPFKDILKESPRRAPEGVTIFRAHIQDPSNNNNGSMTLNPTNQPQLLQSPKRGLAENIVFPPSAVKTQHSPLKSALMSSPAKRLFSPSKQKTPARFSPSPVKKQSTPVEQAKSPGDVDIVMSSHFRPSMSPQRGARVYKMSEEEIAQELVAEMDFDQSVLNVRSPLKVDKAKPVIETPDGALEAHEPAEDDEDGHEDHDGCVEPALVDPADDLEQDQVSEADNDETVLDPALVEQGAFDEDMEDGNSQDDAMTELSEDENSPQPVQQASSKTPRLLNALFHRLREIDDESEDELSADQTPVGRRHPNVSAANVQSRLSTGIAPPSASRGLGFTPLVAQVRDWRAASPDKRMSSTSKTPISDVVFSPLAQLHVAGSVEVNRQDTPAKQAQKRKSIAARLSFAPSSTGSPARPDFFGEGMAAQEFEEQAEELARDPAQEEDLHQVMQQQDDNGEDKDIDVLVDEEDYNSEAPSHEPGELTTDLIKFTNASDTAMVDFQALANEAEVMADGKHTEGEVDDDELQPTEPGHRLSTVEEEDNSVLSYSSENYGDENSNPPAPVGSEVTEHVPKIDSHESADEDEAADEEIISGTVLGDASTSVAVSPSAVGTTPMAIEKSIEMDFSVTPVRPDPNVARVVHTVAKVPLRPEGEIPATSSPVKMQRKRPRSLSTSNSLSVKRRSFAFGGPNDTAIISAMRAPDGNGDGNLSSSPQRRIRSAAPSPAHSLSTAFSTPGQHSFAVDDFGDSTLDGIELPDEEMSSDVEVEDHREETEPARPAANDDTMMTIGSYMFKTPVPSAKMPKTSMLPPPSTAKSVAANTATPSYARSTNSSRRKSIGTPSHAAASAIVTPVVQAATPATVSKARTKTPSTSLKGKTPARTPLKAISDGPLNGVVVHCDIHTSEGSDASAIYVDLLTAMGARCVKEWRWNPRASQDEAAETPGHHGQVIGITHVVYKDGGKRTLEKVRSAGGQVLCVGVAWVLECHRQQSWVDEALFSVDTGVMPRGGSRRRKSMEPHMLKNEGGHLTSKKRKSLPAKHFKYQDTKPSARGSLVEQRSEMRNGDADADIQQDHSVEESNIDIDTDTSMTHADSEDQDDSMAAGHDESFGCENDESGVENSADSGSEISSTYNSPAAATVGETMHFYEVSNTTLTAPAQYESSELLSSSPFSREEGSKTGPRSEVKMADTRKTTPQSDEKVNLEVDYDPRTAATPLTPYMRAKGGNLGGHRGVGMDKASAIMMSAPPKQTGRSLFDDGEEGEEENENSEIAQQQKKKNNKGENKFQLKMRGGGVTDKGRRRTLGVNVGFRPVVGSPLRKEE
ncbi:hypothetical protein PV08_01317 [Exophiala spinifera]|uniref:BRCT domain-containing protein n=1 Tax=Exophiala spinifera TaxID=91928 RepID=A0A0D2CAY7_9EURO|nr:uncharacterized protein PV08_01317 [Exophiala spinifera]KIW20739.1 hypothetical protein PV08_01317 [Exophiala spinifera]